MRIARTIALATSLLMTILAQAAMTKKPAASSAPDIEKLIGAWSLSHIDDGNHGTAPQPTGILIYTRDGHMSVQLMYPKTSGTLSNQYVHEGYEASFGSFDIDPAAHTITHHVLGANTGDLLVGKDLPRSYKFTQDGRLIIQSTRPEEHWSVTWQHY